MTGINPKTSTSTNSSNFGMKKLDPFASSFLSPKDASFDLITENQHPWSILSKVILSLQNIPYIGVLFTCLTIIFFIFSLIIALIIMTPGLLWMGLGTFGMICWVLLLQCLRRTCSHSFYDKIIDIFSLPQEKGGKKTE